MTPWYEEQIIFDTDHLVKCRHKYRDKYYDTIIFQRDEDANNFMIANPQWGVLDIKGLTDVGCKFIAYRVYVARKDDKGYSEDQIKKDWIYSSTHF